MIRAGLLALVLALEFPLGLAALSVEAHAQFAGPAGALAAPGDYSLTPSHPGPASGETSLFYGSHHVSGASVAVQSGPIGNVGVRGFAAIGTATSDDPWSPAGSRSRITSRDSEIGLQKSFLDGTTISLAAGWADARLGAGH